MATALKALKASLKNINTFLKPYFVSHGSAFGIHFAQTIHTGISLFLSKTAHGITHMNGEFIKFDDLIFDIQMQRLRLTITPPPKQPAKGENNNKDNAAEVSNSFKPKRDHLNNDRYRKLFSPRNRNGVEPPLMCSGEPFCWNFHAKGTCKASCPRKSSHVRLNQEEIQRWNRFTTELNRRARDNNSGNNNRDNNNGGNGR